ncbi:MAG: hypothetical protein IPJ65_24360 [Archangiaceae bacterium]|nr:hypothetical protein [Archangiaceae bacterium]
MRAQVEALGREAAAVLPSDPERALATLRRVAELQPDDYRHQVAQANALERAGQKQAAADLLEKLAPTVEKDHAAAIEVSMERADLTWALQQPAETRKLLEHVLELTPSPPMDRTAHVKLAALGPDEVSRAIWQYFGPGGDDVKLLVLREALARCPGQAEAAYLIGRKLSTRSDQPMLAVKYLSQALAGASLSPSIRREALRLKLESRFLGRLRRPARRVEDPARLRHGLSKAQRRMAGPLRVRREGLWRRWYPPTRCADFANLSASQLSRARPARSRNEAEPSHVRRRNVRSRVAGGRCRRGRGGLHSEEDSGTELDDTDDTRDILDVMEKYRTALEKRDAQQIIGLAHESFKDDGGSANPDDDYDYHDLYTKLPATLQRLGDVRLEFNVRKIELSEDSGSARATYTYTASYLLPGLQAKKQSDTEIKQMIFKKVDKHVWKIVSGV